MSALDARAELLSMLRRDAVLHGNFVLSSGLQSKVYLDARLVTLSARGSVLVGTAVLDALLPSLPEAVAGLTLGADPIVTAVAYSAGLRGLSVDGLIVRKEAKAHGTARRIEGPWRSGMRVAVVDDTFTTGSSALEAARGVTEAGGLVTGVYALIDRDAGARAAVEEAGYTYHPLFSAAEVLHAPGSGDETFGVPS